MVNAKCVRTIPAIKFRSNNAMGLALWRWNGRGKASGGGLHSGGSNSKSGYSMLLMSHVIERFSIRPKGTPNMRRIATYLSLDIVSTGELRDMKPFKAVKMMGEAST